MGKSSQKTCHQIKDQVANVPQSIFNVSAKYPKIEHIADQVHPTAMHEHAGEDAQQVTRIQTSTDLVGDHGVAFNKSIQVGALHQLQTEHKDIQEDQAIIDYGKTLATNLILDWNHGLPRSVWHSFRRAIPEASDSRHRNPFFPVATRRQYGT